MDIDRTSYRSLNHSPRPAGATIDMIVLHDGEGTKASDLRELTRTDLPVAKRKSAHYYIDRAGRVYELVSPSLEAWHAGVSSWLGRGSAAIRNTSIGIESEHKQGQDWPTVQKDAFRSLCLYLIERHPIKQDLIAAHRWIAPGRKFDPTDWPNEELRPWIAALFAPPAPLTAATLPGPNGAVYHCSAAAAGFYLSHGGLSFLGYPLADEARSTGTDGRTCSYLTCERAVIKTVTPDPTHLALLSEASAKGWF